MRALKPRDGCLWGSAPEEEIASLMSIRPILMILSKQSENLNGKNWLRQKLIKTGSTTYNVCVVITTIIPQMNYGC